MRIAIIGCGYMGGALARHFAKKHQVLLCDHNYNKSQSLAKEIGAKAYENTSDVIKSAEIVVLAFKPKALADFSKEFRTFFTNEHLVISVLAGTSIAALKRELPQPIILRTMPNLALAHEEGVIGLVDASYLHQEIKQRAENLLEGMGLLYWLPESKIEALTALASSGLAFIFVMIEAMIEGGVAMGLHAQESREILLKTLDGALALLRETGKHTAELKQQIASPGGTTIAGLNEMESAGVRAGIMKTLLAAYHRGKQMSEEANKEMR